MNTEEDLADRMSNALTEVGETTTALVFAEREACAKVIEDMIKPGVNSVAIAAFEAAIKAIRNRPR
jgi:hypothetical protein